MLHSLLRWLLAGALFQAFAFAQVQERVLRVEPEELTLEVGETAKITARIVGADGEPLAVEEGSQLIFLSRARRGVSVESDGTVTALKPGTYEIAVRERGARRSGGENQASREELGVRLGASVRVTVRQPELARLALTPPASGPYAGTTVALAFVAEDVHGRPRKDVAPTFTSTSPEVASIDAAGRLTVHRPGIFTVRVAAEDVAGELVLTALENPVASLELEPTFGGKPLGASVRTGDVVRIGVTARDASGAVVADVPVELTFTARPTDTRGSAAAGQIEGVPGADREWRFVAEKPGSFTLLATSGRALGRASLEVVERNVGGKFRFVGHGPVRDMHTSDLWVWEGLDGRDYAVTGTWGADGDAIFWDVTDPSKIERIATVKVDARTVNDVKVSSDGRLCVLSREGASNRRNGIVLVDVSDPRDPRVLSGFDEELTGGVHNVFIDGNTVYALSAGQRYDTIDVSDPGAPKRVGSYKVAGPSPSIHDVWVVDGLAYSSNWSDGVHIVDVGNGVRGGTRENPVPVSSYAYPSGWNHAAFPFRQKETGNFYVVAGDEAFPNGLNITGKPTYPRGWLHFIDFTDIEAPVEVARYEVPEAGTHNLWIEDDICYCAYYNAGLRAVDVSGELMGDLYRQGREIAWYIPDDPEGYIPNAPMAWGPQPHKGHVFFSDWNSGLWAVELVR